MFQKKLSENEAKQLRNNIDIQFNNKEYNDVIKALKKLDEGYGLNFKDYQMLICSFYYSERFLECSETCKRLISDNNLNVADHDYVIAYRYMTESYYRNYDYEEAIESGKQGLINCNPNDHKDKALLYFFIGLSYERIGNQKKCIDYYHLSLETLKDSENISNEDIILGNYHNKEINTLLLLIGKNYMSHGYTSIGADYLSMGANCGDSECIRYCKLYHINYKKVCKSIMEFTNGKK